LDFSFKASFRIFRSASDLAQNSGRSRHGPDVIVTLALLPLAVSICCDLWVALYKLAGSTAISTVGALVTAAIFLGGSYYP
jgi:hypothetical protein